MENEVKISKKKTKLVLITIAVLLILLTLFLFWFFNRKYDVTFKVNDSEKYTIKVKYNHIIKNEDIKTKKKLGENFIGWYEVVSTNNNNEVLAKKSFDFSTKISSNKALKAVYKVDEEKEETITITFDTKGGNKIDSITINKGEELTFPEDPVKNGYTFVAWELKDGTPIYNKVKLEDDTTLYAAWKKIEQTKKEEPKKEEAKKEESISLSLSRNIIHRNGYKTAKAIAKVENASGNITYTIDNNVCVSINSTTGELTANEAATGSGTKIKAWYNTCSVDGKVVTVTATLPSGKSASAKLKIEKDLELYASFYSLPKHETVTTNGKVLPASNEKFSVEANQIVTWSAKADADTSCTPVNKNNPKSKNYEGNLGAQCTDGNYRNTLVTATTEANQKITIKYYREVN